ncbi:MAG: lysophospholipid acyltransferase family protein [Opitutaceae bacterium]|jgi:1-acyl-sn-glycerol-3-phosphate acyltransferase
MIRAWYIFLYYMSWVWFAVFGLVLNLGCLLLLAYPNRAHRASLVRAIIRRLFGWWLFWFRLSGVVRVTWMGFDGRLPDDAIYVANHPSLVDATVLLAKIPDAFCIMKSRLMRNPAIGLAANMAGDVPGDIFLDLVHRSEKMLSSGSSLLVFPEGTRTGSGEVLSPLRPGFALVAERAKASVQVILIRASEGFVPRGRAWWLPPTQLPASLEICLDQRFEYSPGRSAKELTAAVENRMKAGLRERLR